MLALKAGMREYLEGLDLEVKDNWQVFPVDTRGLDFLGYVFRHNGVRLRKRIKQNIFRRLAHFRKIGTPAKEIRLALGSYIGWLKYTDSINLKHTLNTFAYAKIF